MNKYTVFTLARTARQWLALACCGGVLLSSAYAQYDEVQGPGPMVAVPQVTVRPPQVSANERARLLARNSQFAPQQERKAAMPAVRPADPRQAADRRTAPRNVLNKGG